MMPMSSGRFAAAYAIDWIAGDPPGMPHPVRFIGSAISAGERWIRRPASPANELVRGTVLTAAIAGASWLAARLVTRTGRCAEMLLAWTTLATRSLLDQSSAVLQSVDNDDLQTARRRLAMIVGRDTRNLDEPEILRAVIETVAEGLCDGVVAPIFYLALGDVPVAIAFKAISTLDSMIGHREAPYLYFGRAAARLDDLANFIPARLTAFAIVAAALVAHGSARRAWYVYRADGNKHASPNAGHSEAAMAGALGVRLGGMNWYGGEPAPKPVLGREGRLPGRADARAALRIAGMASLIVFSAAWLSLRWWEGRA
jgi:adenosylcobinamide-phosphate synthase